MAKNIRIAIVDKDKCQPKNCNYLCKRLCPGVRMGEETIIVEQGNIFPIIDETLCTGCGICQNRCPEKAISIINIGMELDNPLHQYGKNMFRLFSLPTIENGFITGVIGRNGAGKTTAINILSGNLVPNFGDYSLPGDKEKVIEYFRGKAIQQHFEDLRDNKITIAYKIQKVEDIPKAYNKKIYELLDGISKDEKYKAQIIKELELEKLLEKTPKEISGGELQRVAIASTLLKAANLYFFDEYSTFLDIKQRFRIAKILREKITTENSMLLIEHDLAILDYLSDFVHVFFGQKQAYGISSNKKTTKKGINEFLDGFLKEENIRIRTNAITFSSTQDKGITKRLLFFEYPSFTKKLGSFLLEANEAKVNRGEVIGILGANAIGKTTFIKVLAGLEKSEENNIDLKLKISYKPQYIDLDQEMLVRDLFSGKEIDQEILSSELKRQFDLESLFNQKIGELSGGELQKVAIANCLSKSADIYLIDEPSAFLDVELRLVVSTAIKNIITKTEKCAFVVDHDLLLLDYISDRMLLFEGAPGEKGFAKGITGIQEAFNSFLKIENMTFRQDPETKRPRANKPGSQKDQEQKKENKYYYTT
ncbi:MAG TPA: ribosome biogenesis/translation initiation ATPase RLI [archaeon]|nr:ribosome biogenesis/translation initiation ATPase RLI [archaeon]